MHHPPVGLFFQKTPQKCTFPHQRNYREGASTASRKLSLVIRGKNFFTYQLLKNYCSK
jgi:hypothetical protein